MILNSCPSTQPAKQAHEDISGSVYPAPPPPPRSGSTETERPSPGGGGGGKSAEMSTYQLHQLNDQHCSLWGFLLDKIPSSQDR